MNMLANIVIFYIIANTINNEIPYISYSTKDKIAQFINVLTILWFVNHYL